MDGSTLLVYHALLANVVDRREETGDDSWLDGLERPFLRIRDLVDKEGKVVAFATSEQLARVTGVSRRLVGKALRRLQDLGWIRIHDVGGYRVYELGTVGENGRWRLHQHAWGEEVERSRRVAWVLSGKFPESSCPGKFYPIRYSWQSYDKRQTSRREGTGVSSGERGVCGDRGERPGGGTYRPIGSGAVQSAGSLDEVCVQNGKQGGLAGVPEGGLENGTPGGFGKAGKVGGTHGSVSGVGEPMDEDSGEGEGGYPG